MKLATIAAFISSAQAIYYFRRNPFVTNWKDEVTAENCPYGPKRCGLDRDGEDILCGDGQACLQPIKKSATCKDAFDWQCIGQCPKGEVRDPLAFCKCIPEQQRFDMICDSEPVRVRGQDECGKGQIFDLDSCTC